MTDPPNTAGAQLASRRVLRVFTAAGVIAAAAVCVLLNVLVARHYRRWDFTESGRFTLSAATLETLHGLAEPIEVVVFLSAGDPLSVSVRQMLTAYAAETRRLRLRYVDPDRDPAEFLTLQQKYGIALGKTQDGRVLTDAALVIARGDRHWYVTHDDLVAYDEAEGTARPELEQALTEGLRNVLQQDKPRLCFTTGHEEASLEDAGPSGLGELRLRLEKNNYELVPIELRTPALPELRDCRVLVMAGPQAPLGREEAEHVRRYLEGGGSALVLASAGLSEDDRVQSLGLEPITAAFGIELGNDIVIEADPARRLPDGIGESFFAEPRQHAITAGMVRPGASTQPRVLVSLAQSLTSSPTSSATPLLRTSDDAFALREIKSFVEAGELPRKRPEDRAGPLNVAMAAEGNPSEGQPHGPRLVVGPPNLIFGRNYRDPTLLGNRVFLENALAWLAAQPAIVSVPEKSSHPVGLALTEESLGEVFRYVVLYVPGSIALIGVFVLLRRRSEEKRSRRQARSPRAS